MGGKTYKNVGKGIVRSTKSANRRKKEGREDRGRRRPRKDRDGMWARLRRQIRSVTKEGSGKEKRQSLVS
jgi:hypothetical protein